MRWRLSLWRAPGRCAAAALAVAAHVDSRAIRAACGGTGGHDVGLRGCRDGGIVRDDECRGREGCGGKTDQHGAHGAFSLWSAPHSVAITNANRKSSIL